MCTFSWFNRDEFVMIRGMGRVLACNGVNECAENRRTVTTQRTKGVSVVFICLGRLWHVIMFRRFRASSGGIILSALDVSARQTNAVVDQITGFSTLQIPLDGAACFPSTVSCGDGIISQLLCSCIAWIPGDSKRGTIQLKQSARAKPPPPEWIFVCFRRFILPFSGGG